MQTNEKMKIIKLIVLLFCGCLILSSCKPKIKKCRGLVTKVVIDDDSLKSMDLNTSEGSMTFYLKEALLNEGVMIKGDSVIVNYIKGRHDTARALVVTVLPKKAHYVDIDKDTTKELLTVPVDSVKKK